MELKYVEKAFFKMFQSKSMLKKHFSQYFGTEICRKSVFSSLVGVEEIGTGIYNINKYLPFYSPARKASFIEDVILTTTIPIPKLNGLQMRDMKRTTMHDTPHDDTHDNIHVRKLLEICNKII